MLMSQFFARSLRGAAGGRRSEAHGATVAERAKQQAATGTPLGARLPPHPKEAVAPAHPPPPLGPAREGISGALEGRRVPERGAKPLRAFARPERGCWSPGPRLRPPAPHRIGLRRCAKRFSLSPSASLAAISLRARGAAAPSRRWSRSANGRQPRRLCRQPLRICATRAPLWQGRARQPGSRPLRCIAPAMPPIVRASIRPRQSTEAARLAFAHHIQCGLTTGKRAT